MNLIVRRKLKDYDSWKTLVRDDGTRKEKGSRGATVYRSARDPNEVLVVFDWDDKKSYLEYFNMPEVQKALAATGTTETIEVSETFELPS
ncbi:MAG: antibiotic biosynthesis monooxygenase [Chloroflexi bacterium]|nr:antibiotic biosynthesis monooxygenase [Chloroflexota bacterium]